MFSFFFNHTRRRKKENNHDRVTAEEKTGCENDQKNI